jgi:hypothetical protein
MESETTFRRALVVLATGAAALVAACDGFPFETGCAGVGYFAVTVTVRDELGHPQALGATVMLQDGSYTETHAPEDSLTVYGADDRGGRTYDIHVTKPFYNDIWVRGVRAPGGGCVTGHETTPTNITVPIVLSLLPNAPPLRSIYLLPSYSPILDRGFMTGFTFATVIDASPGASRVVLWSVTGDTASAGFDPTTGRLTYRCRPTSGSLDVTATLAAMPSLSAKANIRVQGHPASTTDPPCS